MDKRTFLKATGGALAGMALQNWLAAAQAAEPATLAQDDAFWSALRPRYRTDNRFINLENGFYCFQPDDVLDAFIDHVRAINGEASHYMRTKLDADMLKVRQNLARFAGCRTEELVVTRNTTEALDTVIAGFDWRPGDEAVMATQDYGSMLDMFALQARRYGMTNRIVEVPLHPKSDAEIVQLYANAITPRTKMLMVSHIVGGTGQVLPVAAICAMAKARGVPVMVDGAHSFAHLDFRIPDLGCDYFGSSLHKWLSAPLGVGLLYVRQDNIPKIWPIYGDAGMADDDIRKLNHRGTHPVHTDLTIARAVAFHEGIGSARKLARLRHLKAYWTDRVATLPGIILNTPTEPARGCAIANVGIAAIRPSKLAPLLLERHGIYTVAIERGSVQGVRITPQLYTSTAELDVLVKALTELSRDGAPGSA
ncbi:MAG: aminotransferase [Sphingobium sp.]|nr:MAG: aminotransferase [Sphingobium sp.]